MFKTKLTFNIYNKRSIGDANTIETDKKFTDSYEKQ